MTFDKLNSGEYKTMMGVSPKDMVAALNEYNPTIIGSNCGNGFENMIEIVKEFKDTGTDLPLLIHANAGMPVLDGNNNTIFPETPDFMAGKLKDLISAGADIIGGCCGTTPEHIKRFVQTLNTMNHE
jgi:5-methyltetrahydrofolate--homocysteine methyltransferase